MVTATLTREAWLIRAVEELRPRFEEIGMPIPEKLHVSVGFGHGAKRESAVILGQCWKRCASADNVNHIFISPELDDTARVLDVLVHELIHAADDCESGHKGAFAEAAVRLGLEGPMTATRASAVLAAEMFTLASALGLYPHAKLTPRSPVPAPGVPVPAGGLPPIHSGPRTQSTRMLKVMCKGEGCQCGGYTVRTTAKWLEVGAPMCPFGVEMERA